MKERDITTGGAIVLLAGQTGLLLRPVHRHVVEKALDFENVRALVPAMS